MRIEIDIDDKYLNTEVTIKSPRHTQEIEKMISMMRMSYITMPNAAHMD